MGLTLILPVYVILGPSLGYTSVVGCSVIPSARCYAFIQML